MALPALQKTWQGGSTLGGTQFVNRVSTNSNDTAGETASRRELMLWIKEALVGFNQNPWTVIASSDGTSVSNAGTDHWGVTGDLNWAAAGAAHSWIVLQQSNINAKFQVLIDLSNASTIFATIKVSPVAGFTAANGGTDGTVNNAPTATDEHTILDNTVWIDIGNVATNKNVLTCIQSTDGECTRIICGHDTTALAHMRMNFEVPRLPHPDWVNPCVYGHYQIQADFTGTQTFQRGQWGNEGAAPLQATLVDVDGATFQADLFMSQPMTRQFEVVDQQEVDLGNIVFLAGNLTYGQDQSNIREIPANQDWGTLFDWYWATSDTGGAVYAEKLDTFPAAGNRTFVCLGRTGQIVIGWLDDSATDLKYTEL